MLEQYKLWILLVFEAPFMLNQQDGSCVGMLFVELRFACLIFTWHISSFNGNSKTYAGPSSTACADFMHFTLKHGVF